MSALRPYQSEALDALVAGWRKGGRRLGVSLPTGVGKTHIMAHLTKRSAEQHADNPGRVMLLLHRDTLVEQTVAKLRGTLDPLTSVGVLKAERNELGADVIVASVHSLRSERRLAQLPPIKMCVVDEAHVSVSPTYRRVFDRIGAFESGGARLAGFTATWTRSDALGLGDVWEEVVYHKTIQWAVRHGHLVKPRGVRVGVGVDTSGVKTSRTTGDFAEGDLERVVMLEEIRDAVVAGVQRHGAGRPGVLFAPTVDSARYFAEGLEAAGITTAEIIHSTSPTVRRARFAAHRDGSVRVLVTCTALAEGWDAPHCSLGILCRPTKHEGLFVQMAGRLLRPWPGKVDALLLDAVGATTDVHLRNVIDLSVTSETTGGLPLEDDDLDPSEPMERGRTARVKAHDTEVELFAGTQVQWLTSPVGVPFVPVGEGLVFIVEGRDGWCVGQAASRLDDYGRPAGRWVAEGLSQEDALTLASDHAECEGEHLARRSSRWRTGPPSDKQMAAALRMGIVTEGLTRGQVSDRMSQIFAGRVLAPFAQWSNQWRA